MTIHLIFYNHFYILETCSCNVTMTGDGGLCKNSDKNGTYCYVTEPTACLDAVNVEIKNLTNISMVKSWEACNKTGKRENIK